jgi:hypothetical protein
MATIAVSLVALLALPLVALANTSDAIAQTGGMTTTLPLLGSSLTVEVTLDGTGNVSQVNLDPIGTFSASKVGAHAVTFNTADGTTKVKIKAKGDRLSVRASATSLDALVGPGTWSSDVFGTGEKSSVAYAVSKAADGSPVLELGAVSPAAGITVDAGTPTTRSDDHGTSASVKVAFGLNGYTKTLTVRVSASDKGDHRASLEVKLSGKDRQKLSGALADLVGAHTWSGTLCDATAVTIGYNVLADGTVAYGSATGGTTTVKSGEHGFAARFDGTRVRVMVSLKQAEDGTYSLRTSTKRAGCLHQAVPLPTVNTPVMPGASQQGDHKGNHLGNAHGMPKPGTNGGGTKGGGTMGNTH